MHVLAALASVPRRVHLLEQTLATLRPQVDALCVYLNGYDAVPNFVRSLADEAVLSPTNDGAERKFWWADKHVGMYCSCDDDILYPPDYVETMRRAVIEHGRRALVTAHGRTYLGKPTTVHSVSYAPGLFFKRVDCGQRVNHGGTGVMAWDSRELQVPKQWPLQNLADMQLAVWAQLNKVPYWLIAHQAHWLRSPGLTDPQGLFALSRVESHARRNSLLQQHSRKTGWVLF